MLSLKKKCEICTETDSKYKCPQCLVYYCSLNCYKKHKELCKKNDQPKSEPDQEKSTTSYESFKENAQPLTNIRLVDYEDEVKPAKEFEVRDIEYDFVSLQKLKQLETSDELKQILANKHLRELLVDINNHDENIDEKMQKAMQEPLFQEFGDACLKIVQKSTDLQQ